jgi:hypothetical protein
MASYLDALGLKEGASAMKTSADEAKAADQRHNQLAEQLLRI